MTIDESIENLVLIKKLEDSLGNISGYTNSVASQSLGCAIEIMRKYQKIEEILDQLIDSKIRTYDAVIEIEDIVYGQAEDQNEES